MTNEEYYIRSTVQKRQVICDMYDCDRCPLNFLNEYATDDNGDLFCLNDGCLDYEAVQKWLKEEHKEIVEDEYNGCQGINKRI